MILHVPYQSMLAYSNAVFHTVACGFCVCTKGTENGARIAVPIQNSLSAARRGAGENPTPRCARGGETHPVTSKLAESPGVFHKAPS